MTLDLRRNRNSWNTLSIVGEKLEVLVEYKYLRGSPGQQTELDCGTTGDDNANKDLLPNNP